MTAIAHKIADHFNYNPWRATRALFPQGASGFQVAGIASQLGCTHEQVVEAFNEIHEVYWDCAKKRRLPAWVAIYVHSGPATNFLPQKRAIVFHAADADTAASIAGTQMRTGGYMPESLYCAPIPTKDAADMAKADLTL